MRVHVLKRTQNNHNLSTRSHPSEENRTRNYNKKCKCKRELNSIYRDAFFVVLMQQCQNNIDGVFCCQFIRLATSPPWGREGASGGGRARPERRSREFIQYQFIYDSIIGFISRCMSFDWLILPASKHEYTQLIIHITQSSASDLRYGTPKRKLIRSN